MNIIITGASSGIGYATALCFAAKEGNKVMAIARNSEKLLQLSNQSSNGIIIPAVFDLSLYNYDMLDTLLQTNNISHVDVLIHCAGQLINKPFENIEAEEWEQLYKANVIGPAQLTRHLLPLMGGEHHTHIVMIGSIGGINGSVKYPGLSAYSSSKGALITMAECMAEEFKEKNIYVNCLALGAVQTEMLTNAFPGYTTLMSSASMAEYIYAFSMSGWKYFNGKILPVSNSNP